jgi:hypothetical protein
MSQNTFKPLIIEWNNSFPLDKWFRKKYNLPFNSEAHRQSNPIDIYFEYQEDKMFDEYDERIVTQRQAATEYAKGNWIKPRKSEEQATIDAFDNIDIGAINSMQQEDDSESESE